jgi:hypothetical protein
MKTNCRVCWIDVCMVRGVSLNKAKFLFDVASIKVDDYYLKKSLQGFCICARMDKHITFLLQNCLQ